MPSTYTTNNGIEKIATGEQSGTWGDTTNVNFDLLDEALDGQVSVALAGTGTSGSPNDLAITDGTSSNGRNRFVEFTGTPGGDTYVRLTPNDAEKVLFIQNSTNQTLLLFQGTYDAARDYSLAAGLSAVIRFTGGGTTSYAYNVFTGLGVAGNVDITGGLGVAGNVDITGGFTATSGSTITTADNLTQLTLISTDPDASEGPRLDLRRDSASPAAADLIGTIRYLAEDSIGTSIAYGEIQLEAVDVTTGAASGQMRLMVRNAGNLRNALTLDNTQYIFNESGDDVDVRIESTGDTHAFFFEGSSGNVGIGASSPSFPLDIRRDGGGATVTARLYNNGTLAADDASLRIGIAGTTGQTNIFFGDGDSSTSGRLIYDHNNDAMVTYVNGSEAMRIASSGNVGINTANPVAALHINDVGTTGPAIFVENATSTEGDITWDSAEVLQLGTWNKSTNTFNELMTIDQDGDVTLAETINFFIGRDEGGTYDSGERGITVYAGALGDNAILFGRNVADGSPVFRSQTGGTTYAEIEANGDYQSATNSYGGVSDQTLKENIVASGSQWDD
jgi:hypothetical protein